MFTDTVKQSGDRFKEMFGWNFHYDDKFADWTELTPEKGGTKLGLHSTHAKDETVPQGEVRIGLGVKDLKSYHEMIQKHSVKVAMEPMKTPWGGHMAGYITPGKVDRFFYC